MSKNKDKNNFFKKLYNKNNKNYYLGLDIGTNSIGWAIHTEENRIINYGDYLSEADDSKTRRGFRGARRTNRRQKYRLNMFENLAIKYNLITTNVGEKTHFKMFDEYYRNKRKEAGYNEYFPTIYHLKKKGLTEKLTKEDLFLVLYHSLKIRGHFLLDLDYDKIANQKDGDEETIILIKSWLEEYNLSNPESFFEEIKNIRNQHSKMKDLKKSYEKAYEEADKYEINTEDKRKKEIIKIEKNNQKELISELMFISGAKVKLNHIEGAPEKNINLLSLDEEPDLPQKIFDLNRIASLIEVDIILGSLQNKSEKRTISTYMVDKFYLYSRTNEDGSINFNQDENINKFNEENKDFVKEYKNKNKKIPYLRNFENRKLPNQLYYDEALQIIHKQQEFYPELDQEFEEKYKNLIRAKIPYFIGPLVQETKDNFSWIKDKPKDKHITPYNIKEKLNYVEINKDFIDRMVKQDPYFKDEKVLPERSYTYEYFKVLNDLNNFKITLPNERERSLKREEKQILIEKLYKNKENKSITKKKIQKALENYCNLDNVQLYNDEVNDITIYSNLKTYIDLVLEVGLETLTIKQIDNLASILTLYEDKTLKKITLKEYLNKEQIGYDEKVFARLMSLNYQGYGQFSYKFLNEYKFENNKTLIQSLETEDKTLNEILKDNGQEIQNQQKHYQEKIKNNKLDYSLVSDMYASNIVKAMLNNLFIIMNELHKIYGIPKEITIEMAREDGIKKQTISRKEKIKNLYDSLKKDKKQVIKVDSEFLRNLEEIQEKDKIEDKVMLYIQQEGKDLYSYQDGKFKNINLDRLQDYDIDHIVPYSFNFNDSLDNKILTLKSSNSNKGNKPPYEYLKNKMDDKDLKKYVDYIEYLRKLNLISSSKKDNLLIKDLNKYMKQGFKNSQLNDTRYITKEIIAILSAYYNVNEQKVKINTIKAGVIKPISNKMGIIKIREITDKHHAIDAYLASIVNKAIKSKYPFLDTINSKFIKEHNKQNSENKNNDQTNKVRELPKVSKLVKKNAFVNNIVNIIYDSEVFENKKFENETYKLVKYIDSKKYNRVFKVRKKITGEFWHQNYKKETEGSLGNLLSYKKEYENWKNKIKEKQVIDSINSGRIDIYRKNGKNYIFAVPKSYFIKNNKNITVHMDAYNYGLKVMNENVWNPKDKKNHNEENNIELNNFKFTLWIKDLVEIDDKKYFVKGGVNKFQNLEITAYDEKNLMNLEILEYMYDENKLQKKSFDKLNFLENLYQKNSEIKFKKENKSDSSKTISLLNMIIFYKMYDSKDAELKFKNINLNELERKYWENMYNTPEKQEISKEYFKYLFNNGDLKSKKGKEINKKFISLFSNDELKEIDFKRFVSLNIFELIREYNAIIPESKQDRIRKGISKNKLIKFVQNPLGNKTHKIYKEKFQKEIKLKGMLWDGE